jgi:hypothetical protein
MGSLVPGERCLGYADELPLLSRLRNLQRESKRPTGKPVGRFCLGQRPGSTSSAKLPISRS